MHAMWTVLLVAGAVLVAFLIDSYLGTSTWLKAKTTTVAAS